MYTLVNSMPGPRRCKRKWEKSKPPGQKQRKNSHKQADVHPNSLKIFRVGQGKGKSGENGQMHHYWPAAAFTLALQETMHLASMASIQLVVDQDTKTFFWKL